LIARIKSDPVGTKPATTLIDSEHGYGWLMAVSDHSKGRKFKVRMENNEKLSKTMYFNISQVLLLPGLTH